jgi:putative membrane protein
MKKISFYILITALCVLQACNNTDNKDSVEKANDANAKKDTTSVTSEAKKDTMAAPVNDDVAKFAVKVANAGMTEIELGKMAEEKGSKSIKEYGTMMVKDHTKAGDELKRLRLKKISHYRVQSVMR